MNEEILENEQNATQGSVESKIERQEDLFKGAQMLENPAGGNFIHGLQTFVAWVKSLVAPKD